MSQAVYGLEKIGCMRLDPGYCQDICSFECVYVYHQYFFSMKNLSLCANQDLNRISFLTISLWCNKAQYNMILHTLLQCEIVTHGCNMHFCKIWIMSS